MTDDRPRYGEMGGYKQNCLRQSDFA